MDNRPPLDLRWPTDAFTKKSEVIGRWGCNRPGAVADGSSVTAYSHLVAHTRDGWRDVVSWDSAIWLWDHLRQAFGDALAGLLMLDHLHLLAADAEDRLPLLRRILQHHARRFGARWDLGPVTPCHTRAILRRTARYIFLNPPRDGLIDDPLAWPFSTLRDAMGITADPWGGPALVRRELGYTSAQLHAYVTSDENCSPAARKRPRRFDPSRPWAVNLDAIASACASALRCSLDDLSLRGSPMRSTFVALALRVGAPRLIDLAERCAVSVRAVHDLKHRADPAALEAAARCLADPRLLIWRWPTAR